MVKYKVKFEEKLVYDHHIGGGVTTHCKDYRWKWLAKLAIKKWTGMTYPPQRDGVIFRKAKIIRTTK